MENSVCSVGSVHSDYTGINVYLARSARGAGGARGARGARGACSARSAHSALRLGWAYPGCAADPGDAGNWDVGRRLEHTSTGSTPPPPPHP